MERDTLFSWFHLPFEISTHTLTWSVTFSYACSRYSNGISTHTLTWSVTIKLTLLKNYLSISTHTLTWSVTSQSKIVPIMPVYFNSHAHVERDIDFKLYDIFLVNFNSHAHVERDYHITACLSTLFISTHTLTWSVTAAVLLHFQRFQISTHTLTWSVTYDFNLFNVLQIFQLTRSRGA